MHFWWVRLGDAGDYQSCCDLCDVAGLFLEFGIKHVEYADRYSVECDGRNAENRISLYWGDKDAQPICSLSRQDVKDLNKRLNHEAN